MNTELGEDEVIIKKYSAELMIDGTPRACRIRRGNLYLTNLRIIFEPKKGLPEYFVNYYYIDIYESGKIYGNNIGWTVDGTLYCEIKKENIETCFLFKYNGSKIADYINKSFLTKENIKKQRKIINKKNKVKAKRHEKLLEFEEAAKIYKEMGMDDELIRVRKLKADMGGPKTEIHGDYIDDRDTIIKDSVVSKSNIGGGSSKMQELKDLTEMKKEGLIDDAEFKQMKKEILGK